MLFLTFAFPFFQISNDYCQKSYNGFRVFLGSSNLDLHIFDKETAALLNFFEICTEMHFVSLFFLYERNNTNSLLMIHIKCIVAHYSNLNSSSAISFFFQFLIYVYFNEDFVKRKKKNEVTIIF